MDIVKCEQCLKRDSESCPIKPNIVLLNEDFCSYGERKIEPHPWNKVIEIAKAEIGYKETGYNHNKYAQWFDKYYPGFYHTNPIDGYAWCGVFVNWCFTQAYGFEEMLRLNCAPRYDSKSCGVREAYSYYNKQGRLFHGKDPHVGDQVFFGQNFPYTTYDHTGLIIDVTDNTHYTTIEGNYKDGVYLVNRKYSEAVGWGRPKWD